MTFEAISPKTKPKNWQNAHIKTEASIIYNAFAAGSFRLFQITNDNITHIEAAIIEGKTHGKYDILKPQLCGLQGGND